MSIKQSAVTFQRPAPYGWLLLLSDWHKAAVLLAVTLVIGIGAAALRPEYPLYICTGLLGALAMLRLTDAAELVTGGKEAEMIRLRLARSRFHRTEGPERWVSPLPPYLRWRDAVVTIDDISNGKGLRYRITGPYSALLQLNKGL